MKRPLIITTALILLVGLVSLFLNTSHLMLRDGTPDDRLLTTMQYIALDAQKALDETGQIPDSLKELLKILGRPEQDEIGVSYERLGPSTISLCGDFEKRSGGQKTAHPYFDVSWELDEELTTPRPVKGRHCYDMNLEMTEGVIRHDALLYREMDARATAIECAFGVAGDIPRDIQHARELSAQNRADPSCSPALSFLWQPDQTLQFSKLDSSTVKLCAEFAGTYDPSREPARIFDPKTDARFSVLAQKRPNAGKFCYLIKMLFPDPPATIPTFTTNEPFGEESVPEKQRDEVIKDKRAIGDVVNILRLARCAHSIKGAPPASIDDAIQTIVSNPSVARRYSCGWAPSYYHPTNNTPVATYTSIDDGKVRVCAEFQNAWKHPLALVYSSSALADWPRSLPELQRSFNEPGQHCFEVQLSAIGSGTY
ncbi:hypothetical protein [Robiginitomaculum antarcticum]|uniref:hypothetical protein n=1 Tax=Robiginitomaculum antarcticum TaxID=437507 RepID=UPI0003757A0E|nr:hypothetical protein [Robiginitomaculum antarcticum]